MPLPTLEKLRMQCRIDEDNDQEDELLLTYLQAAKSGLKITLTAICMTVTFRRATPMA